jgi:hypothetical protein
MSAPVLVFEARRHAQTRERDRIIAKVRRLQRVSRFEGFAALEAWLDAEIEKREAKLRESQADYQRYIRGGR